MRTATSQLPAITELGPRLQFISEQFSDLLERDLSDSEERCLQRHFERIWERLEPAERDAIRNEVDDPFQGKDVPECYRDVRCFQAIAEFLGGEDGLRRREPQPL